MAVDSRLTTVKEEIKESQLTPLPPMALNAFALALIAERDDNAAGVFKWLTTALKQEAK
jgi:hypothetical protein